MDTAEKRWLRTTFDDPRCEKPDTDLCYWCRGTYPLMISNTLPQILFVVAVTSGLFATGSLVFSILHPDLRVWPPPAVGERAFRTRTRCATANNVFLAVSAVCLLGLVALDSGSLGLSAILRWVVGALLFGASGALALWGYLALGPAVSQGAVGELESTGAYRFTRNPQYVGTIGVLLGLALLADSVLVLAASLVWCLWFVLAPFAEEPWLREKLGPSYDRYLASTRRFL